LQSAGKTGRVIAVDSDGDVKVEIEGKRWVYNPQCCINETAAASRDDNSDGDDDNNGDDDDSDDDSDDDDDDDDDSDSDGSGVGE
jgi:Mind bomb SH3 repeat domain